MVTADAERLPWLDPPRAHLRPVPVEGAARRSRMPLLAVLALFLMAGVAVIAYLAGHGSVEAPTAATPGLAPDPRQATIALPAAVPPPPPPPQVEVEAAPPPVREIVAEPVAEVEERAPVRATAERRTPRAARPRLPRRALEARRALVEPQRVVHASKVVQLGAYRKRRHAEAAYRRLERVYPYLATLPKTVSATRPPSGYARAYVLRLKAHSPDHARILCQNLLSIGRGCVVLPELAVK